MGNVNIINHPLVKHKITLMRDEKTGTREFRILVEEVAMLMPMQYEVLHISRLVIELSSNLSAWKQILVTQTL